MWRHQDVELTGTGSPSPVAPGSGLALTRTSVRSKIPEYIVEIGYNAGILKAGENEIPARVWVALSAPGTAQGVHVSALETTGRTTITTNPDGTFQSATPIDVTVPIPDTAWTVESAAVGFRQAPAGSVPPILAGVGDAMITPLGSVYIAATMGSGTRVNLDCQPATGEGQAAPAPFTPGAFETVAIDTGATVIPAPKSKPKLVVRSSKLRAKKGRVALVLSCSGAVCKGSVSSSVTRRLTYTLAAGARKTVKLTLSAKGRRQSAKKSLKVKLTITAAGGEKVVKRMLDDELGRALGLRVGGARAALLAVGAALGAAAVAVCGAIAFVGLLAPHAARLLAGGNHRRALPMAMALGALLLATAGTVGRTVLAPTEIPSGLVVSLIGAPYLAVLLWRSRTA